MSGLLWGWWDSSGILLEMHLDDESMIDWLRPNNSNNFSAIGWLTAGRCGLYLVFGILEGFLRDCWQHLYQNKSGIDGCSGSYKGLIRRPASQFIIRIEMEFEMRWGARDLWDSLRCLRDSRSADRLLTRKSCL